MKIGQVFTARDVFELYGLIRSRVAFEDCTPHRFTIYHFSKISDSEFLLDDMLAGTNHDGTQKFISKFPDYDTFCGIDATGQEYKFSFGSFELYATVIFTPSHSWTEIYEDHLGNPVFDEYIKRQVLVETIAQKKNSAS